MRNRMSGSVAVSVMWFSCMMLLPFAMTCHMAAAETKLPTLKLMAGLHPMDVEVASTYAMRRQGLMNRISLPPDGGMLFVYPQKSLHCMWMQNTKIPLSAAFVDEHGIIVNIAEMLPDTTDNHCAESSVMYVIEMRSGWFQEKGIGPGAHIQGLGKAPVGR